MRVRIGLFDYVQALAAAATVGHALSSGRWVVAAGLTALISVWVALDVWIEKDRQAAEDDE